MRIGISYTEQGGDSTVHSVLFENFLSEDLPRSYSGSASFSTSAGGSAVIDGPAFRQRYIWGISALVTPAEALALDSLFRDWDADRASGMAVAVGVTDELFGSVVNASAVFSTPPAFTRLSPSAWSVDFGLSEV